MGSRIGLSTLNSVEFTATIEPSRSDDAVCSLSDILETGGVPQRYYLTAKACAGILRRAEKRGKTLPEPLEIALMSVVSQTFVEPYLPEPKGEADSEPTSS